MDATRFQDLLRTVTNTPSRRGIARAVAGFGLSGMLTTRLALSDAEAKKKRKKRKKKKTKCPTISCNDNSKNGDESDIDCGGRCNRCINGKACASLKDCKSGLCASGTCVECGGPAQCGSDANGACNCELVLVGELELLACNSAAPPVATVSSCEQCAPNLNCVFLGEPGGECVLPCGVP